MERGADVRCPARAQLCVKAWGRPGDTAMIALVDGFAGRCGLVPALHGEAAPGYGFVDEQTPELPWRSSRARAARASAARCSHALLERARADGYAALSLSVDRDNEGADRPLRAVRLRPGRRDAALLHAARAAR